MTHDELQNRLDAFLDGELPSNERAVIEAHLARCESCEAAIARWRAVSKAFFQPRAVSNSEHAVSRIMSRIREAEAAHSRGFFGIWRWTVLALGLATFGLLATLPSEDTEPGTRDLLLADRGASLVSADAGNNVDVLLTTAMEEI